jgi:hypothetical protein
MSLEHSEILFLDMESWKNNFNYWTYKCVEAAPVLLLWYIYSWSPFRLLCPPPNWNIAQNGFTILEKWLQLNVYIYIYIYICYFNAISKGHKRGSSRSNWEYSYTPLGLAMVSERPWKWVLQHSWYTLVPLSFSHKLNYFSFCQAFEKIFIICVEILINLKVQLSKFEL